MCIVHVWVDYIFCIPYLIWHGIWCNDSCCYSRIKESHFKLKKVYPTNDSFDFFSFFLNEHWTYHFNLKETLLWKVSARVITTLSCQFRKKQSNNWRDAKNYQFELARQLGILREQSVLNKLNLKEGHMCIDWNKIDVDLESFEIIDCGKGAIINRRSSKISRSWSHVTKYRKNILFVVVKHPFIFAKGKSIFSILAHKISNVTSFEVFCNYSKHSINWIQGAIQLVIVTFWREIVSFVIHSTDYECIVSVMRYWRELEFVC